MFDTAISAIDASVSKLTGLAAQNVNNAATITPEDHFAFQTIQSQAFTAGRISLETSQWLYHTLGGHSDVFNRQPLAVRIVTLHAIKELAK